MKKIIAITILLTQFGFLQAQIKYDGFGDIRLGTSYKSLKKKVKPTQDIPEYAWFAPMSLYEWVELHGGDSLSYLEIQQGEDEMNEEEGLKIIYCSFTKKNDQTFAGLKIECAKLIFREDILTGLSIVLDAEDVTKESKNDLISELVLLFGETYCSYSVSYDDPPFYCSWEGGESERILVSDMIEPGFGPGKSVNIAFGN